MFLLKNMKTQNLIQNGSFENFSAPANWNSWSGQFYDANVTPIVRILYDWDEFNSADLLTSACTHTFSGVPVNRFGYITPKDGNNIVGLQVFPNVPSYESKEYIYQHLIAPLQTGKTYSLSFYVSKADRKEYAIKNMGAYFSNTAVSTNSLGYINATPQVVNQGGFITDTLGWTEIQGCFTAIGGEQYITIGNFNSNANTDTLYTGTNNPIPSDPQYAYYYIDDIILVDQSTVGINDISNDLGVMSVYPNPNNGIMQFNYILTKKAELIITDITGRILNIYVLDETQKNTAIKEYELKTGIYFYSVKQNNVILKQDKFVIIK